MKQTFLPPPTTQLQEVFRELLSNKHISVRQMIAETGILHPKARILDLRRMNIPIHCEMVDIKNKYGRSARFGQWSIPEEAREKAIEKYLKLLHNDQ